jgi:hypothetical protein
METGSDYGSDWRAELAAVSGAMPYEPGQPRFDGCVRAYLSVGLPFSMVAALGASFCNGVKRRRRPKRHETMCEPVERRQCGGNNRRPELATVSGAMPPNPPRLRRRALGRVCAGSRSGAGPNARLSVRLSVPMVAAVSSSFRTGRARNAASRRIHDRARGARAVSLGHHRVGQHAVSHLPLFRNAVLREHP